VIIGDRLREIRQHKKCSRDYLEQRTGLSQRHIALIESGQAIAPIEMLEKLACALEVQLHHLFYDSERPPGLPNLPARKSLLTRSPGGPPGTRRA
jgi:transcriptional regulator with XRE-family HTH domain